jgi:hypothetical protein
LVDAFGPCGFARADDYGGGAGEEEAGCGVETETTGA